MRIPRSSHIMTIYCKTKQRENAVAKTTFIGVWSTGDTTAPTEPGPAILLLGWGERGLLLPSSSFLSSGSHFVRHLLGGRWRCISLEFSVSFMVQPPPDMVSYRPFPSSSVLRILHWLSTFAFICWPTRQTHLKNGPDATRWWLFSPSHFCKTFYILRWKPSALVLWVITVRLVIFLLLLLRWREEIRLTEVWLGSAMMIQHLVLCRGECDGAWANWSLRL